jgi:anti-anti-sigma factor
MGDDVDALDAEIRRACRDFSRFVLNVKEVDRLDSIGIGSLVRAATNMHKAGGDVRLAEPPAFVLNLLKITHLSGVLRVYPTEEEAILSFLERQPVEKIEKRGTRVLFFDPSPEVCAFVRAVLTQHGFDVKWTSSFGDAKILLRMESVEHILVGPGTPQLSAETALRALRAISPSTTSSSLAADFKTQDAQQAAEKLLEIFKNAGAS